MKKNYFPAVPFHFEGIHWSMFTLLLLTITDSFSVAHQQTIQDNTFVQTWSLSAVYVFYF